MNKNTQTNKQTNEIKQPERTINKRRVEKMPSKKTMNRTPKWFNDLYTWRLPEDYEPTKTPHLKVAISVQEPEHDGYCSEVDGDDTRDDITYITRTYYKNVPLEWTEEEIKSAKFSYKSGCRHSHDRHTCKSGYCGLTNHVRVIDVIKQE